MVTFKKIFFIQWTIFFFGCPIFCAQMQAQAIEKPPFLLSQLGNYESIFIASKTSTNRNIESLIGIQKLRAPFDNVSQYFADFSVLTLKTQRIGIQFFSDRIGNINEDLQINARYSFSIPLTENHTLTMGAFLGVLNSTIRSSISGTSGSSFAPNASLALSVLNEDNWNINASLNQLTQPILRPLYEQYVFPRYFLASAHKNFDCGTNTKLKTGGIFYSENKLSFVEPNLELQFADKLQLGVGMRTTGLSSVRINLIQIPVHTFEMGFGFNYNWQLISYNSLAVQYFTVSLQLSTLE